MKQTLNRTALLLFFAFLFSGACMAQKAPVVEGFLSNKSKLWDVVIP